jgi:hypothetical protein
MTQPLTLTYEQLAEIKAAASTLPPRIRGRFLSLVAQALRQREFSDAEVARAVDACLRVVGWVA